MDKKLSLNLFSNVLHFLTTGIWRIRTSALPFHKAIWIRLARMAVLSFQGFEKHNCMFRASALTFYSLLSIVPVLAMAFGLAKGFGFEKALQAHMLERFQGQEEIIVRATGFANSLLENTKGGVMAGIGILLLFWTIIRMLQNMERAFNRIWGIEKMRSLGRKISDYLSAMLVCPVLFMVSGTATVVIATYVRLAVQKTDMLVAVGPAILFVLKCLPYMVMWILFTFVYMFMPNRKIPFKSALFAGIAGGTLYQIFQWIYVGFQIGVAKYNAIYGSFAALPLFLVWLQVSWMIVLFGAEISCAHETEKTYDFEPDCAHLSTGFKRLITLRVAHFLVAGFSRGTPPQTAATISATLDIPIRLVWRVLHRLVASGILSEVCDDKAGEPGYQPAQDVENFTIQYIIEKLDNHGRDEVPVKQTPELEKIAQCLASFEKAIRNAPENLLLKDI